MIRLLSGDHAREVTGARWPRYLETIVPAACIRTKGIADDVEGGVGSTLTGTGFGSTGRDAGSCNASLIRVAAGTTVCSETSMSA